MAADWCLCNTGAAHVRDASWSRQIWSSEAAGRWPKMLLLSLSVTNEAGHGGKKRGQREYAASVHFAVRQGALSHVGRVPANQSGLIRPVLHGHGNARSVGLHEVRDFEAAQSGVVVTLEETKKRGFVPQGRAEASATIRSKMTERKKLRPVCERVQLRK